MFQPFPATFSGVGKTESTETREHLDELFLLENGLLIQVWTRIKFFLAYSKKVTKICQNLLKNVCTNVSMINSFFPKTSFFYHFRTLSWSFALPGKTFQLPYWNCSLSVYYINLRKIYSPICSVFLGNPRHWARKNRLSFKTFPAGLSKLYYTCPEDQSGKKISYLFVSYRFRTLRETCLAFSQSLFSITLKFEFYMSIETIQTVSNIETSLGKKICL